MAVNHYFNNYNSQIEQWLVEDLFNESIQIMGFDAYYIPISNTEERDILYGEDPLKRFSSAYPIEMYLSEAMDPGLEKDYFSKFGLQIQNTTKVMVTKRSFSYRVPQNTHSRPLEGDLIYVPFLKGTGELYEIKFVNVTKDLYVLGRKSPYFYELELELFKYSQERIDTGIPDIDIIASLDAYSIDLHVTSGTGAYKEKEIVYQGNSPLEAEASATVASWDWKTKVLKVTNISGEFVDGHHVKGAQSLANYTLTEYDELNLQYRNPFDNKEIQEESITFIDNKEHNSFGSLG